MIEGLGTTMDVILINGTLHEGDTVVVAGRGLHSSTFRLNVSTSCGIRWVHCIFPVY
jgi:hypothetical protein